MVQFNPNEIKTMQKAVHGEKKAKSDFLKTKLGRVGGKKAITVEDYANYKKAGFIGRFFTNLSLFFHGKGWIDKKSEDNLFAKTDFETLVKVKDQIEKILSPETELDEIGIKIEDKKIAKLNKKEKSAAQTISAKVQDFLNKRQQVKKEAGYKIEMENIYSSTDDRAQVRQAELPSTEQIYQGTIGEQYKKPQGILKGLIDDPIDRSMGWKRITPDETKKESEIKPQPFKAPKSLLEKIDKKDKNGKALEPKEQIKHLSRLTPSLDLVKTNTALKEFEQDNLRFLEMDQDSLRKVEVLMTQGAEYEPCEELLKHYPGKAQVSQLSQKGTTSKYYIFEKTNKGEELLTVVRTASLAYPQNETEITKIELGTTFNLTETSKPAILRWKELD